MLKTLTSERIFNVVIERDEDKFYVASVELPGCHTQAKSLDQLTGRIKEAIKAYLDVAKPEKSPEFVGVRQLRMKFP